MQGSRVKGDDDELSKPALSHGKGKATRTGQDTALLGVPGGTGNFRLVEPVLGFYFYAV